MARRPQQRFNEDDFESLEGRASKTEQKKAVQRMAALGEQLANLSKKQIQQLPVEERLIDALLDVQLITSFEARRRQFQRIGKLLRNEDETVILSYLTPQQGLKKTAQLQRWVDRIIAQGDPVINEFAKMYNATERHTLRQHLLRVHRDMSQQADEEQIAASKLKLFNYVQQVALISDNTK
ncbi:ribosome biogenesis factor YjgA [Acinetobacter rudis]|uniref:Ribosome biogenesis factor YjgA n=1 Tax=Acinetobacter rudis TaxID=632955 RepID=A0AAW8J6V8_9GAMM|nr:ribosome biogenesis factor YjgA [Acinetobacter rudis]MDQ8934931.1 ribosome biogenesis factor YjgA [Acinetobacter rudis]MDQ8952842.1 ribosome biogenesis factor YjgA [Acinetobacter rudis]MDQ9017332.1 ribosome biogenesis factor YjgA [Acinetobacter rudis]